MKRSRRTKYIPLYAASCGEAPFQQHDATAKVNERTHTQCAMIKLKRKQKLDQQQLVSIILNWQTSTVFIGVYIAMSAAQFNYITRILLFNAKWRWFKPLLMPIMHGRQLVIRRPSTISIAFDQDESNNSETLSPWHWNEIAAAAAATVPIPPPSATTAHETKNNKQKKTRNETYATT